MKEQVIDINALVQDDHNFNKGTEAGRELMEKSFKQLGAGRSVLIDKDGRIIAGNKSQKAAIAAGIKKVRIIETTGDELVAVKRTDISLDSKEGRELALADNLTTQVNLAWDEVELDKVAAQEGIDLPEWGIDPKSLGLQDPTETKEAQEDDFDEEKDKVETVCKKGDIWLLGQHRLMCGDSTLPEDVARLMDGEKASMVYTDPPYGMHLDTDYGKYREDNEEYVKKYNLKQTKGNSYKPVAGDNDDFKPELVTTIFDNFDYCKEIFVWGGDYYPELLKGYKDGNYIVWDKKSNEGLDKALDSTNSNNFEL